MTGGMWHRPDGTYDRAAQLRHFSALRDGRSKRWRGKLSIPPHCHPLVRQFFALLNSEQVTLAEVASRAGVGPYQTMSNWRYGQSPSLQNFEAAINALGYELKLVRKP